MSLMRISLVKLLIRIIKDFIFYIIMSNDTGHFMRHTVGLNMSHLLQYLLQSLIKLLLRFSGFFLFRHNV